MTFTDYAKAAVYPSLALSAWSLLPLLPPWFFPGVAAAYWESEAVYVWPLLLAGAFAAGTTVEC